MSEQKLFKLLSINKVRKKGYEKERKTWFECFLLKKAGRSYGGGHSGTLRPVGRKWQYGNATTLQITGLFILLVLLGCVRDGSGKPTARHERGLEADSPTRRGTPKVRYQKLEVRL